MVVPFPAGGALLTLRTPNVPLNLTPSLLVPFLYIRTHDTRLVVLQIVQMSLTPKFFTKLHLQESFPKGHVVGLGLGCGLIGQGMPFNLLYKHP